MLEYIMGERLHLAAFKYLGKSIGTLEQEDSTQKGHKVSLSNRLLFTVIAHSRKDSGEAC